jgi:hypothetical protein
MNMLSFQVTGAQFMDFEIPLFGKPIWLVGVFLVSLALFHIVLIYWLKLTKRQWKQIDYVWISIGVLGLFGSGISLRRALAAEYLEIAQTRLAAKHQGLTARVRGLSDSRVCRTFGRSESSAAVFDETQTEFDQVCDFGRRLAAILPDEPTADLGDFRAALEKRPPAKNELVKDIYAGVDRALANYVAYFADFKRIKAQSEYGSNDLLYMVVSPNLIAIALALRMTKVTGEMRLERSKS